MALKIFFKRHAINQTLTYAGDGVVVADTFGEQTVADFPCKYGRTLALVVGDFGHDARRGHTWLRATDCTGLYGTRLVIPENKIKTIDALHTQVKQSFRFIFGIKF